MVRSTIILSIRLRATLFLHHANTTHVQHEATSEQVFTVSETIEVSCCSLIANEWIIKINNYGYTGVNVPPSDQVDGVVVCDRHTNATGQGHINPTGKGHTTGGTTGAVPAPINSKSFQVVHKDYALDYT